MKEPLVSILMTVYNREIYLPEAITSVINSTYDNWELIIVDDCSKDKSFGIAKKYEKSDSRIRVYKNERNLGDYPNRNKAASLAKGTYLKYLDADDMIYPHTLEIMVDMMEKYPHAAMGISQYVAEDFNPYPFVLSPLQIFQREFLKRGVLGFGPTATIIRKEIFNKIKGFSGKRYIGDIEFWLKIAEKYPILKMQDGLIFWRRHEGQEIDFGKKTNAYLINNYILKIKALNSVSCPLSSLEKIEAINKLKKRHARDLINMALKKHKLRETQQVLKKTKFSIIDIMHYTFLNS